MWKCISVVLSYNSHHVLTFNICGLMCLLTCVCPIDINTLFRKSDSSKLSTAAPNPSITDTACFCNMSLSISHSSWFSLFILTIFGNNDFTSGSVSKNLKKNQQKKNIKKNLKISKRYSEAVNRRRTDNKEKEQKDKQWSTEHYIENKRLRNIKPIKKGVNSGAPKR